MDFVPRIFGSILSFIILGLIPNHNQLHSESAGGAVVARHGEEHAVRKFSVGTRRKADGGIAIAKSGLDGGAELGGIEEAANVGLGEMRVRQS